MDVAIAVQNGNWDARMAYYMKLELDRPVPRYRHTKASAGVEIDSHSLAVFLSGEMLGFDPPVSSASTWTVILSRSVPDETEDHRNYLSPYRIHIFAATQEGIILAKKKLESYMKFKERGGVK